MKKTIIKRSILLFLIVTSLSACNSKSETPEDVNDEESEELQALSLEINQQRVYQIMDNFGASDAWSGQFVGNWPSDKKQKIADLLFSQELDPDGNPEGIGISLWRLNIGAGSAEQGAESGIRDEWRRAPSFLKLNNEYDWNGMESQVWLANAAKAHGVDQLLIFSNSPHVNFTRNGKAFTNDANHSNLAADKYDEFAEYLAIITEGLQNKGLEVDYISPVNEPQWDWADGGQEGTPLWNNEIVGIVKALNKELEDRNLSASIDIPEAGQINYLYEEGNRPGRSNQIQAFFNESSENYIADLAHVSPTVSGHSYFTTSPFSSMIEQRERLSNAVDNIPDLKYWMSEYCILGDNNGEIEGNGRDLGIDPALYLARVIHSDLTVANASAWHWWLAVSPYDYKDGLIYIDKNKEAGEFYESKMLWALGNYSRFIRPGYQRIDITNSGSSDIRKNFLFSAYKNPENDEVIVVLVNSGNEDVPVQLQLKGEELNIVDYYVTSSNENLKYKKLNSSENFMAQKKSITTFVLNN
ncbi:glycoside hydrolase family 30 protein [Salegentibacter sp. F188]|uniref:Glycoside hydrolase family 30 protein n=1 Tax=Autumnicola patrickiae TaxID=3075591 RepID=A0ABU3E1Y9_9FLAO|nr:glycoside hydrolase family 30 protein [Salegentibacter sp. F188]MDT0689992.1 glycoside hydrolase family 30 protein [Salegentibacter sp. F188]